MPNDLRVMDDVQHHAITGLTQVKVSIMFLSMNGAMPDVWPVIHPTHNDSLASVADVLPHGLSCSITILTKLTNA